MPRYQMTKRLVSLILEETKGLRSFKSIAQSLFVSTSTVIRLFDKVNYSVNKIDDVICIDEFKGNLGGFKYQAVMVNPRTSKVINIATD